jgi:hypothetical protein
MVPYRARDLRALHEAQAGWKVCAPSRLNGSSPRVAHEPLTGKPVPRWMLHVMQRRVRQIIPRKRHIIPHRCCMFCIGRKR